MVWFLIVGLLGLMLLGLPVAISMLIIGLIYLYVNSIPLMLVVQFMLEGSMTYVLIAIPMYLLAAAIMNETGISRRVVRLCSALVGHVRGGLAQVNVLASVIMAGMSGEAVADTASVGGVMIPAMEEEGYDKPFAAAVTAGTAVIGPIIPPSVPMIICASLASTSIGRMFMGGLIPGLILSGCCFAICWYLAKKRNYPVREHMAPFSEVFSAFNDAILGMLTIVIILGGVFTGIFTPIEAAGVAVIYSLLLGGFWYRALCPKKLAALIVSGSKTVGVIMFIIALASFYNFILIREQIPQQVLTALMGISTNKTVILIIVTVALFFLGCFLSTTPAIMLTVPVLLPLVEAAGYDKAHFFVILTMALLMGTNTPPVGINLYLCASIAKIDLGCLVREMLPFYIALGVTIFLCIFFPALITAPAAFLMGQ